MTEHMNILLLIGISVFLGLSGGKIFQKMKIPQVVGYIIIGVLLGDSFFGLLGAGIIDVLTPLNSFALGMIGFMIGGELRTEVFRKYGWKFIVILLFEGLTTFCLVTAAVTFYTGKLYLGILFGALASATAPAATTDVLWEYKSKGILTTTILAIVALDDGLALILYGFSSAFAKTMITGGDFSFINGVLVPIGDISLSILLGVVSGYILYRILLKISDREQLLVLSIGAILVNTGLSSIFDLDLILSNMAMGVILINRPSKISQLVFDTVKGFTPPLYVLFFVLVGARLQVGLIPQMGILGCLYLISRTIGKFTGSYLGALVTKAEDSVRKYLGFTLFSQAGVAIGLAIAIYQSFGKLGPEGEVVGNLMINVIAATTFIVQLVGPPCVKFGITKAGEVGKDITEEDILSTYTVKQVMESNVETISAHETLSKVVDKVRNSSHLYFPVVDYKKNNRFLGVISFQNIKDVIFERGLGDLVLASEVATYDIMTSTLTDQLQSVMDKLMLVNLNYIPVIESEQNKTFMGILHKRAINTLLKNEIIGQLVQSESAPPVHDFCINSMIKNDSISLHLEARQKKEVISEMVNLLAASNTFTDLQGLIDTFLERESQTTTGVGEGIAIPHIRTTLTTEPIIAFGRSEKGIDFGSVDSQPVYFIFMVMIPERLGEKTLQIMSRLSRLLRNQELKEALKNTEKKEQVVALLKKFEMELLA